MHVRAILLGTLLASAACSATQAKLEEPQAELAEGHTAMAVDTAVRAGLAAKQWKILAEAPGSIDAEVASGGHFARVRIAYDASGWKIGYLEASPGLKYAEHPKHGAIIHHRYNLWIGNLDAAIRAALNSGAAAPAAAESGEAPAADTDGETEASEEEASSDTHADEWD